VRKISAILVLMMLAPALPALAQPEPWGNWLIWFGNARINKHWSVWNEVQVRQFNLAGDMEQLMLRAAVNYHTASGAWLSQGYGRVGTWRYTPGTNEKTVAWEHRPYQQVLMRQQHGRVFLTHRYRVEERFLPDDFQLRFRYFLSLNIPLNKSGMDAGAWYATAYSETFLRYNNPTFDRHRLYGGIGYVKNKDLRFELAWMEQQLETRRRGQLQLVVFRTFDWPFGD
jgi:hypothetical protein